MSTLKKLRHTSLTKILRNIRREQEYQYKQIEALTALHHQLSFRLPLPPMRGWTISPDFAVILLEAIQINRPGVIVELGGGTSTLVSGYCLEKLGGGQVIAFDHIEKFADLTRENVGNHGLGQFAQIRHAPLKPLELGGQVYEWYDPAGFAGIGQIDLLVVDGPTQWQNPQPQVRYPALPVLADRLADGAIVLMDDSHRKDEQEIAARWQADYRLELIREYDTEKGTKSFRFRR